MLLVSGPTTTTPCWGGMWPLDPISLTRAARRRSSSCWWSATSLPKPCGARPRPPTSDRAFPCSVSGLSGPRPRCGELGPRRLRDARLERGDRGAHGGRVEGLAQLWGPGLAMPFVTSALFGESLCRVDCIARPCTGSEAEYPLRASCHTPPGGRGPGAVRSSGTRPQLGGGAHPA